MPAVDKTPNTQFLLKSIQQIASIFMWTNFRAMNYMMLYDTYKMCVCVYVYDSLAEDMRKIKASSFYKGSTQYSKPFLFLSFF